MMKRLLIIKTLLLAALFVTAQTDILPPVLVAPEDGDDNQMPDVTLDWYASSGIGMVTYEAQLDTSADFTNPTVFNTDVTSAKTSNLLFGTTYYWRVRATDEVGTSDWSETFSFTTFSQVELYKPNNAAVNQNPRLKLVWKVNKLGTHMTGVTYYDYELSLTEDFSNLYASGSINASTFPTDTSYNFAIVQTLLFDTTYYWHVRARHSEDMSDWSEPFSFTTLSAPTLDEPSNGATDQMLDLTLSWDMIPGAYEYMYEFCTDPTFQIPCLAYAEDNMANPQGISFGTTYYWRVKALHTNDTTDWSEVWELTTINTVYPSAPANNSYVDNLFPTLSWEPITGVSGFQIMFADNDSFENAMEFIAPGEDNSYKILNTLVWDQTYFWKLRAFENGDTTQWSEVWSFTVGVSGTEDIFFGRTLNVYPNPVQDQLHFRALAVLEDMTSIDLLNSAGQVVKTIKADLSQQSNTLTLNVSDLPAGIYLLRVNNQGVSHTRKVIIRK
ncbi:MAG: hypothetical protein Kow00127_23030 [Bacteroidales bacterium]